GENEFIQRERELDLDRNDKPSNIFVGSVIGGGSHLNPILEICKILEGRGYKITLVAPGNFTAKSTLYHSIPQIITGELESRASPTYREVFFYKYTFKTLATARMMSNKRYIENFNKYLQAYKETKPDLFICDYVANEACFDLAWKFKQPIVGFSASTMIFTPPPPYRSDPIFDCHVSMENESFYNRFICAVVQPLRLSWQFRKNINYLNSERAKVGVSEHNDFRGRIINTLFLVDNFFGFE
ncbi:1766_t:CDS:2, partial [Racocetra persica]